MVPACVSNASSCVGAPVVRISSSDITHGWVLSLEVVSNVYENKERHSRECLGEECPAWRRAALDSRHLDFYCTPQCALPTIKNPAQHDHRDATTTIPQSVGRLRQPVLHRIKPISSKI